MESLPRASLRPELFPGRREGFPDRPPDLSLQPCRPEVRLGEDAGPPEMLGVLGGSIPSSGRPPSKPSRRARARAMCPSPGLAHEGVRRRLVLEGQLLRYP